MNACSWAALASCVFYLFRHDVSWWNVGNGSASGVQKDVCSCFGVFSLGLGFKQTIWRCWCVPELSEPPRCTMSFEPVHVQVDRPDGFEDDELLELDMPPTSTIYHLKCTSAGLVSLPPHINGPIPLKGKLPKIVERQIVISMLSLQ